MINQTPGNNLVLYTLGDRIVFQRQAIVYFGTIIHDDEVVTTLTMMMNICNSFKERMTNATLLSKSISKNQNLHINQSPYQRIKINCNGIKLNAMKEK